MYKLALGSDMSYNVHTTDQQTDNAEPQRTKFTERGVCKAACLDKIMVTQAVRPGLWQCCLGGSQHKVAAATSNLLYQSAASYNAEPAMFMPGPCDPNAFTVKASVSCRLTVKLTR